MFSQALKDRTGSMLATLTTDEGVFLEVDTPVVLTGDIKILIHRPSGLVSVRLGIVLLATATQSEQVVFVHQKDISVFV